MKDDVIIERWVVYHYDADGDVMIREAPAFDKTADLFRTGEKVLEGPPLCRTMMCRLACYRKVRGDCNENSKLRFQWICGIHNQLYYDGITITSH